MRLSGIRGPGRGESEFMLPHNVRGDRQAPLSGRAYIRPGVSLLVGVVFLELTVPVRIGKSEFGQYPYEQPAEQTVALPAGQFFHLRLVK